MNWYEKLQNEKDIKNLNEMANSLWLKDQRIKHLEEENKKLTDEYFKDEKLKEIQEENKGLHADIVRGFSISEKEQNKIDEIKRNHKKECSLCSFECVFECYSIVEFGFLRCKKCGKEFKFCER